MRTAIFHGIIPAVPTAFYRGQLDLESMRRHFESLLLAKVHGVVVCGSTGEGATVTDAEYSQLLKLAREVLGGKMPIIAAAGSNSTAITIEKSQLATEHGADALLLVTPYYNKPPQEGLIQHFKAVAALSRLPIILYNVPGRTACNLLPESVEHLAKVKNIIGIKEASASMGQGMELVARVAARRPDFAFLSGEDLLFLPLLSVGFGGVITVLGNAAPKAMVELYEAWCAGDVGRAQKIHYQLRELCEALFAETNPIPLKAVLCALGIFSSPEVRPPLCGISDKLLARLKTLVKP